MTERVLDWQRRFDTRSLGHKVSLSSAFLPQFLERPLRSRVWKRTVWLDQGSEGACVGFSCAHEMTLTPRRWSPEYTDQMAKVLYREAQKRDQWAGENYVGSSVLGGMQALKDRGEIKSYRWCTTVEEVLWALSYVGPVVIGVNWYAGMFAPDESGHLHTSGRLAGGHAIVIGGIDPKNERVLLYNSWGKKWGKDGGAWLSFAELDRLLHEDGEFAVPLKARPQL